MSFIGYIQVLCERDHYSTVDCYDWRDSTFKCEKPVEGERCNRGAKCTNLVDQTNGEEDGKVEMIQMTEDEFKKCDLGFNHLWNASTWLMMPDTGALGLLGDSLNY